MGYALASGASVGGWLLFLASRAVLPKEDAFTPFVPGFAALVVSALWTGRGPNLLAAILTTVWCVIETHASRKFGLRGEILRDVVFVFAGILLCVVSARLRRTVVDLSSSEDWHRRLVETSAEGIWVVDAERRIVYANPRIAELLGCAVEAIIGSRIEDYFFADDQPVERIRFQNRRAGMRDQFDRRLRRSDGRELWVLHSSNPFFDQAGQLLGILSMMTDITERKLAEQALRRSEAKFRGLFENVLEGVYQSTPEGRVIAANPMLLRMLGLRDQSELNAVSVATDLYPDPAVRTRLLEQLGNEGYLQNVEYQLRRVDGRIITVRENARTVRDDDGRILYYEGTLTDVTETLRMEAQLRHAQAGSGAHVAAGLAQDVNNAVKVISGYAQRLLADIPGNHPARENALKIAQLAESAEGLTRRLASLGGEDAGETRSRSRGESILVVDPDPLFRELSRDMLERQGYSVTSLESWGGHGGQAGIDSRFDVLIAGENEGGDLARSLRHRQPDLKVLLISGYNGKSGMGPFGPSMPRQDDGLGQDESPLEARLQKPFSADVLGRTIRQMLDRS